MNQASAFKAKYCDRISRIDRNAWNSCFPGEAEAHEYYTACESAQSERKAGAVCISRSAQVVAVAPVFSMQFRLDASFQDASTALSRARRWLAGRIEIPIICVGSPFAERCHVGVRAGLDQNDRIRAVEALFDMVELWARGRGVKLVAVKDVLGAPEDEIHRVLSERGYAKLSSLPIASLDLTGFRDVEEYLASLSPGTRRDLRRKLRSASAVRIEDRHDIADIASELVALYEGVRKESRLDYGELEELPADYFVRVAHQLRERALFRLYWVGPTLAAFNLLLLEESRIIDKFLGMRYPMARDCNLYAVSWVENVRLCLARGVRTLQTGQTAYREKVRFGSQLVPSSIWFKHRSPVTHRILRALAPMASFDRNDPELGPSLREAAA